MGGFSIKIQSLWGLTENVKSPKDINTIEFLLFYGGKEETKETKHIF